MAGTVDLSIHFHVELRAIAVPPDEMTIVESDAGWSIVLLSN
jgi:hypothetical protein